MDLEKIPSIIENNKFNEKGLIVLETELLVPVYIGSQLGFNEPGKLYLNKFFYPKLRKMGAMPLCPFTACEEYLDFSMLNKNMTAKEQLIFWNEFNKIIGIVNYEALMPKSKFMIALFDGGHAVDDGLSAEVAHFANKHGPVIGIRSDFRLAENPAAPINPAIRYFIDMGPFAGQFFDGCSAYANAFSAIEKLANQFRI